MAILNSGSYAGLNSVSAGTETRAPGKFKKVFITGAVRKGQEFGKMQVMSEVSDTGDYLVHNATEVYFIPYFIKRFWEKTVSVKGKDGSDYDKLVAFSWDDKAPKLDDQCKFQYLIAGPVLDPTTKKAMTYQKDYENAGIKTGDPILIYFKCGGIRFNSAMAYLDALSKKGKDLVAMSDSPEFEKNVVTPKRFISQATVTTTKSDYGDKQVNTFTPMIQLPDAMIQKIMDAAAAIQSVFEEQFDRTNSVKSEGAPKSGGPAGEDNLRFDTPSTPSNEKNSASETKSAAVTSSDFDLGI